MAVVIEYSKARISIFDRRMDYFNEIKLIIIMYHLLTFTAFVPDIKSRFMLGYSCAGVILIGVFVNMTMLFVQPIQLLKRSI